MTTMYEHDVSVPIQADFAFFDAAAHEFALRLQAVDLGSMTLVMVFGRK